VGTGGGAVGLHDKGRRLTEYVLDAAKAQIETELGKNISLYPSELLADRFLTDDLDRYRNDLKKFLRDPGFFDEDQFEDIADFIRDIRQNQSPGYKKSCGNKLWRFYTEYLKVQPQIEAEAEEILKHFVRTVLDEGYSGVLLVLDEVSLFMKNRDENQRSDDEKTLVVLSNRLAKIHNLPIWTVCAAQQALESKMGVKNIIADDRLKLVKLLENDKDYYDIVLSRVREIKTPDAVSKYYLLYKRGFSWQSAIGEAEFARFFPFHKPAIEVLKAITFELTTTRSAIHFMHQTLKYQIKNRGDHIIRLWELFDEAVRYEEDPSGVNAGLTAIKTKRETDFRAYESCKHQIEGLTKGYLKVYRDKAIKIIQTLFLYFVAKTRQQGISPEDIANSVLLERDQNSDVKENIEHYETLTENLKKELRQIVLNPDEEGHPRYRFDPVFTGVDPRDEFQKARDDAEANPSECQAAWKHLLALDEWIVRTRQMNADLSGGVRSIFRSVASEDDHPAYRTLVIRWQGRQTSGRIGMGELGRVANENRTLPAIGSDETDLDFAVFIGTKPVTSDHIRKILDQYGDPRLILWVPDELTPEERSQLTDFAAYRKLVRDWQGKESEDAVAVIHWVFNALQTHLASIWHIVQASYARGRMDSSDHTQISFDVTGELESILSPVADRVLSSCYVSKEIRFDPPFEFRKEEGVKVINGIVKTGNIPKGAKPNQNISAARNFGFGLKIMKKSAERVLNTSDNPYIQDLWDFVDDKLTDPGQTMKMETLYKNFMGIGGPRNYGLTRRMVEIYLLCLMREGKIRISVGPKSGLPSDVIDYANMSSVDFSVKVLNAMGNVQKVEKPENWDVLRPYTEKLLNREIPENLNDAEITRHRTELKEHFSEEKDGSARVERKAGELFEEIGAKKIYEKELRQIAALFDTNFDGGDDIQLLLYALKDALGYQAFDTGRADSAETDDLANQLKNYRDMKRFLMYERELKTASDYCAMTLPESWKTRPETEAVRSVRATLCKKMKDLQPYIDSEVKLKTELIGNIPPEKGDSETLGKLIHEYTLVYRILHDDVLNTAEASGQEIQNMLEGDDLKALKVLENISALQPGVSREIEEKLQILRGKIFSCPSSSKRSVEKHLRRGPVHECGLTPENAGEKAARSQELAQNARQIFEEGMNGKMSVFLTPSVRERLEQGRAEPVIREILSCEDVESVRKVLVGACLKNPSVADKINRYLKRISVKTVRLSDFVPSVNPFEKDQIIGLADEFREFLEKAMEETENDDDVVPMIRIKG